LSGTTRLAADAAKRREATSKLGVRT